jgi:hypothetical protein
MAALSLLSPFVGCATTVQKAVDKARRACYNNYNIQIYQFDSCSFKQVFWWFALWGWVFLFALGNNTAGRALISPNGILPDF